MLQLLFLWSSMLGRAFHYLETETIISQSSMNEQIFLIQKCNFKQELYMHRVRELTISVYISWCY